MAEDDFHRWLEAPVAKTSDWSDWRKMPGGWYGAAGIETMATVGSQALGTMIAASDARLAGIATNEDAIEGILEAAEQPYLRVREYDPSTRTLIAGTLTYGENVEDFLHFLSVLRGAARFMRAGDEGLLVIEDYVWGSAGEQPMALRLGASGASEWLDEQETSKAVEGFRSVANAMLKQWPEMW